MLHHTHLFDHATDTRRRLSLLLIAAPMLACLLACRPTQAAQPAERQTPAFPGAEGFGAYTTGGRGGAVCHVTTLDDGDHEGTLRWACRQEGPRTIVFDVSGTIYLTRPLRLRSGDVTMAGQTAPGDGICVADYPFTIEADNVIVRYMRFRLGNRHSDRHEGDGLGAAKHRDIIIDHCSVSWSVDECLSVYGNWNSTVQWCIVSHSLVNAGHSKGSHAYGGNWGGSGATFHHNLIAHHTSRTPRLGPCPTTQEDERMDMRNNVIYNWAGQGCYGGEAMTVNIVANYYKPGPATLTQSETLQRRIAAPNIRTSQYTHHDSARPNVWDKMWHVWGKFYVEGNVNALHDDVTRDNWTLGVTDQVNPLNNDDTWSATTADTIRLSEPMPCPAVTTQSAEEAYERVLADAGCSLHRDAYDKAVVDDVRQGTATFTARAGVDSEGRPIPPGLVGDQDDCGGWPELASLTAPRDTDGDGIPDHWEATHGLNPHDPHDGARIASDGYTCLEHYLNSLVDSKQ